MTALWPDTIVEEANLAFQISALRKVLEDGGNGDSLIQTVPTKGYRFAASVTISGSSASARGNRRLLAGAAVGAACRSGCDGRLGEVAVGHSGPTPPATTLVFTQLTANPAEVPVSPQAMSPDGKIPRLLATGPQYMSRSLAAVTLRPSRTRGRMEILGWNDQSTGIRAVDRRPDGAARSGTSHWWERPTAAGLVWPGRPSRLPRRLELATSGRTASCAWSRCMASRTRCCALRTVTSYVRLCGRSDAKRVFFVRSGDPADTPSKFPVQRWRSAWSSRRRRSGHPTIGPPGRDGLLLAFMGLRGRARAQQFWQVPVNVDTGTLAGEPKRLADWREGL